MDVELSLGSKKQVHSVTIDWEYPAKAFEVQVAEEGSWTTIYATSGNNLNRPTVLTSILVSQIRVRMKAQFWGESHHCCFPSSGFCYCVHISWHLHSCFMGTA